MKAIIVLLIALLILTCFSCRDGDKTKIVIEKTMAEKIELPDKLKVTDDLKIIRHALVMYLTTHEAYPSSINELNLDLYFPDDYEYDSEKGTVSSKSYPYL